LTMSQHKCVGFKFFVVTKIFAMQRIFSNGLRLATDPSCAYRKERLLNRRKPPLEICH